MWGVQFIPLYIISIKHFLRILVLQTSVLHMCSLFHAFIFAQLWTVYCEQTAVAPTVQNQNEFSFTAILTALEFWSRVTPSILQLMAHNKVVSQMVCTDLFITDLSKAKPSGFQVKSCMHKAVHTFSWKISLGRISGAHLICSPAPKQDQFCKTVAWFLYIPYVLSLRV